MHIDVYLTRVTILASLYCLSKDFNLD